MWHWQRKSHTLPTICIKVAFNSSRHDWQILGQCNFTNLQQRVWTGRLSTTWIFRMVYSLPASHLFARAVALPRERWSTLHHRSVAADWGHATASAHVYRDSWIFWGSLNYREVKSRPDRSAYRREARSRAVTVGRLGWYGTPVYLEHSGKIREARGDDQSCVDELVALRPCAYLFN